MTILTLIDELESIVKHLPGRHDQQRHAGSRGVVSGGFSAKDIQGIVDRYESGLVSDTESIATDAAEKLRAEMKSLAYERGFGDEFVHWSGASGAYEEWKKFQPVASYMPRPDYIPEGQSSEVFPSTTLSNYYVQEPAEGGGKGFILEAYREALTGEYGSKHQAAAGAVRDASQAVFRRKYGNSAKLYRSGELAEEPGKVIGTSTRGISVSESSGLASLAASVTTGEQKYTTNVVRVNADDILFGARVVPSPYPEKEWVVSSLQYE